MRIVMMSRAVLQIIVFLDLTICLAVSLGSSDSGDGVTQIRCKDEERRALVKIKDDLEEVQKGALSSWRKGEEGNRECCDWIGIRCHNISGNVISLDLSPSTFETHDDGYSNLKGNISSSLVELEYLNYLDLSFVDFDGNSIPSFIGSLRNLRYLNLSHASLSGEAPPQLGNLSSLQVLDLSHNSWQGLEVRKLGWASHLSSLRVLDLSFANMGGAHDWVNVVNHLPFLTTLELRACNLPDSVVTPHLSLVNSSKTLSFIDLSMNYDISISPFPWLFNHSHSLVYLDLSNCRLNTRGSFLSMTALTYLDLSDNGLESSIRNVFGNMIGLTYIDLSNNQLKGSIPKSFGNMTAVVYLSLSNNLIEGAIPEDFGNMVSLEVLDLSNNKFEGEFPKSILQICSLRVLMINDNNLRSHLPQMNEPSSGCPYFSLESFSLSHNKFMGLLPNFTLFPSLKSLALDSNEFNGSIPESIGKLFQLASLYISNNYIEGVISEAHFSKLFNLTDLDLSSNSNIVLRFHSDWVPPFQLIYIYLGSCKFDPNDFPKWLQTQNSYVNLNISNCGISASLPGWFWNLPVDVTILDLSNNKIRGTISDVGKNLKYGSLSDCIRVDLSSNQIEGSVPQFLLKVDILSLQKNRFSNLNSLCNVSSYLAFLDISYNQLTGDLPDCWSNMSNLQVLILSSNMLTGKVPSSIGSLTSIYALHLSNNSLAAELPLSLKNCRELVALDVGNNVLSGPIPAWMGKSLTKLVILSLRSNNFSGSVPFEFCHLVHLQVLDFSANSLSGSIPNCVGDINAMKNISNLDQYLQVALTNNDNEVSGYFGDKLFLLWKGALSEFTNLGLLRHIDLSSNKLKGDIPKEITTLIGLISLNLSRNNLSGKIPKEIGSLRYLDSLDLSRNHLFGQIPQSISQIDRLGSLDLSSNNLSGKIPTGPQLQNRDAAYYMQNPELCGAPLLKKCPGEEEPSHHGAAKDDDEDDEEEEDHFVTKGFYICAAAGYIAGLWGLSGALFLNKSWRLKYFEMLDNKRDWFYVTLAVQKARLLRFIEGKLEV